MTHLMWLLLGTPDKVQAVIELIIAVLLFQCCCAWAIVSVEHDYPRPTIELAPIADPTGVEFEFTRWEVL